MRYGASELARLDQQPRRPDDPFHVVKWATSVLVGAALPFAPFAGSGRTIRRHRQAINAAFEHGLPNALTEATNTKIRLITGIAFGFGDPAALIALAMLSLGAFPRRLPTIPARKMIMNNPRVRQENPFCRTLSIRSN